MSNTRKKIILNEILFWKQNNLLPDHYCDFLMTLYSEGNELETSQDISHKKSIKAKNNRKLLLFSFLAAIITIALISILLYSQVFTWLIAIATAAIACFAFIATYRLAMQKDVLAQILQVSSALLIFGLCVKAATAYFPGNSLALLGLLAANCLLWLSMGIKFRLLYFTVSGVVGLILLIGYQIISMVQHL